MSTDLIQSALKDILAQKQDHTAGSVAYQRMERVEAALRALEPQGLALPELHEDQALPCPFCKSTDISDGEVLTDYPSGGRTVQSMCRGCGALGPEAYLNPDEIDYGDVKAITAWNRRASQLALPAGPVPEGAQPVGTVVSEWKETDHQEYDKVRAVEWFGPCSPPEGTLLYTGSPAVAQPVEIDPHAVELAKKYAFPGALYPKEAVAQPMPEIVSDLRHSAKVDGYTEAQAKFINSIADRLAPPALAQPGSVTDYGTKEAAVAQPVADERAPKAVYQIANDSGPSGWSDYSAEQFAAHTNTKWRAKRILYTAPIDAAQIMQYAADHMADAYKAGHSARAALCQPAEEGGKA